MYIHTYIYTCAAARASPEVFSESISALASIERVMSPESRVSCLTPQNSHTTLFQNAKSPKPARRRARRWWP